MTLRQRNNNIRQPTTIPHDNDEGELLRRYNNLEAPPNSEEELLRRYNDLRTPLFQDIPPSLPLPLRRPDIEKEYDDTFLRPPQSPTVEALKTDFDCPITNLIDKANNVIGMIQKKKEKQDLDKYDLYLREQLSTLFPEVEDRGGKYVTQGNDDDQKINELPIPKLTEILTKIDKREAPKQLDFVREVWIKNLKIRLN